MSIQVSIYTREAFREYLLPPVNNSDHVIVLNREYFSLEEDIRLKLEITRGSWRILPAVGYRLDTSDSEKDSVEIVNGAVIKLKSSNNEEILLFALEQSEPLSAYSKYDIKNVHRINIGRNKDNEICFNNNNMVSGLHAVITSDDKQWKIVNHSANGLYVNDSFIEGEEELKFGDYVNVLGLHLVFLGEILALDARFYDVSIKLNQLLTEELIPYPNNADSRGDSASTSSKTRFHRPPRSVAELHEDTIEIEEPPAPPNDAKQPLLLTIGPSFTMALPMLLGCVMMIYASRVSGASTGVFMYSGLIMAVSSAGIGVTWSIINLRYQKKREIENETKRFDAYSKYLIEKTERIKKEYRENKEALEYNYPSADACSSYGSKTALLWNRNETHPDYLSYRVGMGNVDFQVSIDIPKDKFSMVDDALREKPGFIKENYRTLYNVPVTLNVLEHRMVGIVSGEDVDGALDIARVLSVQMAACNCYTDLKLVYLYNDSNPRVGKKWEFAKWLPHVWSEDKKTRYVASSKADASDVCYELAKIFRKREEEEGMGKHNIPHPYFVFFISDLGLIENELLSKYVLDIKENYGLSVIVLSDFYENLPNNCSFVIENSDSFKGMYDASIGESSRREIEFDSVKDYAAEAFARRLNNIEVQETELGGEIPQMLTFFDMYGVGNLSALNVADRWIKNRTYDHISGYLGAKAGDVACVLDVHEKYHGPHGLVAGTTGSGKSETLQTYLLSLAVNYSPDDVGFFIIDYKGGGMANLFNGLPHMIGQISNLSGNQVNRAMVSIKSENQRRQRKFNESGVNNINSYTKLYKNGEVKEPIPHLFIVIDEFAELKNEEPDFMRELISVAQVGRSLGVHLILATQKPAGTVNDNIWSNSKFRICLRVQDRQDSLDMLHKADAAYITQAGRGYLQVGNDEVYELFQSGWSGAPYSAEGASDKYSTACMISLTGRESNVGKRAQNEAKERELKKWMTGFYDAVVSLWNTLSPDSRIEITRSELGIQRVVGDLYRRLDKFEIEFPENQYNTEKLVFFMELLQGTYDENIDSEEGVNRIVELAEKKNAKTKLPQPVEKTQLDAVRDYLKELALQQGYVFKHTLWMPVLPDRIYLKDFEAYQELATDSAGWRRLPGEWQMNVLVGKVDDPQKQSQYPVYLTYPECGNVAVIGITGCGKSTLLQTMLYSLATCYSPAYANYYLFDFSSNMLHPFENLPHVGGVMYENDLEKIGRFFNMLSQIVAERKVLLKGGNYSQYVKSQGAKLPAVLIVIDNFASFNEKTEEKYLEQLIKLSKEGPSLGIYMVVSANAVGMNDLPLRIAENMATVLTLQMKDKFDYSDVLHVMRTDVLPEAGKKGRGLVKMGTRVLEYQTALSLESPDDFSRGERIGKVCDDLAALWKGKAVRKVPTIPENPEWNGFVQNEDVKMQLEKQELLPVGYNYANAEIYSLNLRDFYCYTIIGAPRTGKRNYLKVIALSAIQKGWDVALIDLGNAGFATIGNSTGVTWIREYSQLLDYCQKTLTPIFLERNKRKHGLQDEGLDETEIFDAMLSEKPMAICISSLETFMETISNSADGMSGFFENLFSKGALHNIYFFGVMTLQSKTQLSLHTAFKAFVDGKYGVQFGGNVGESLLSFDYVPFKDRGKVQKPGLGMISEKDGMHDVETIVVPLVKRQENAVKK